MKSLVDVLAVLIADCESRSGADLSRDVQTLRERVGHEGDSFITITLPTFCADFERSLDNGRTGPGTFVPFKRARSGLPLFLSGLTSRVFDEEGVLLCDPDVDCILLIRQICLFGKKVKRQCSDTRLNAATLAYVQCDDEVGYPVNTQLGRWFGFVADRICEELELDSLVESIVPRHGPGATQERISGNQKWRFKSWHRRLEDVGFAHARFGRASQTAPLPEEEFETPDIVEPEDEPPVRVVFVPKTLKTPRVIAVEPVCMQYAQQGLKDLLVRELEKSRMTAGHVNFVDQSVNQALALSSSASGDFATLDMSEASDRVSLEHVERLFAHHQRFLAWVKACRSTRAELPGGGTIRLKKFASMGSALCFPVEALTFFVSIIASRLLRQGRFPTAQAVRESGRSVYVYGDDLIVPADEAPSICADLELLGFKVNTRKSFWTGKFRESCGLDCYGGQYVTPTYLRCDLPTDRQDASGLVSTCATANQLSQAGFPMTSVALRSAVEACLGHLPQVPVDSPALGWVGSSNAPPPRRWNRILQRWEHLCWVPITPEQPDPIDGDAALAKCFRVVGSSTLDPSGPIKDVPSGLAKHLEVSSRPYALTLKRRWISL